MKNSGSALSKTTTATRLSCSIVVSSSCRATIIAGSTRLIGGLSKVTRQYCGLCWVIDSGDLLGMVCSFRSEPNRPFLLGFDKRCRGHACAGATSCCFQLEDALPARAPTDLGG